MTYANPNLSSMVTNPRQPPGNYSCHLNSISSFSLTLPICSELPPPNSHHTLFSFDDIRGRLMERRRLAVLAAHLSPALSSSSSFSGDDRKVGPAGDGDEDGCVFCMIVHGKSPALKVLAN